MPKYSKMVAGIKGVHLTFLCVVNKDNIGEIGSIIHCSVKNHRLVDFVTFIPTAVLFAENQVVDNSKDITLED